MNKDLDIMKKILEEKKQKSASQGNAKRPPGTIGSAKKGVKRPNKGGGLFDK